MDNRYTFKEFDDGRMPAAERMLVCPVCKETLSQVDIECFARCPFCDYPFELNLQLEDFILEPIVEQWVRQQTFMTPANTGSLQTEQSAPF